MYWSLTVNEAVAREEPVPHAVTGMQSFSDGLQSIILLWKREQWEELSFVDIDN
jgi:hypothetical protein